MKLKIIMNKTILSFNFLICSFILFGMSMSTYASCSLFPGGPYKCRTTCTTPSCKRHVRRSCGQPCLYPPISPVAFYYVQPVDSSCWCGQTWIPGHCGPCEQWVPGYWQPINYNTYYRPPRIINDRVYDPDLATGDDDADIHPDMQINY